MVIVFKYCNLFTMQTIDSENKSGNLVQNAKGRLADDGEIQVKVPSAFFDFYKDQKLTKDSFTSDGWFCTSVNGRFESGKFVLNEIKKSNTVSTSSTIDFLAVISVKSV